MKLSLRNWLAVLSALSVLTSMGVGLALVRVLAMPGRANVEQLESLVQHRIQAQLTSPRAAQPTPDDFREGTVGSVVVGRTPIGSPLPPLPNRFAPPMQALLEQASAAALAANALKVRSRDADERSLVAGAAPAANGRLVWVVAESERPPNDRTARRLAFEFLPFPLLLAAAALFAVRSVQSGAKSLRGSLSALARELRAPVDRPLLTELAAVADGISGLAEKLDSAQREQLELSRSLAQRERLSGLGRVVAGLAHELRNPLTSIKLNLDLAVEGTQMQASLRTTLVDVSAEIVRLDRLVDDLLLLSGRKLGVRCWLDLAELAASRTGQLQEWAEARHVRFSTRGSARAFADADALARALDNLLRNAVEASPRGATVELSVEQLDAEVRILVIDSGAGIPASREAQLFEPFATNKPRGTGLGLALAHAAIVAHRGELNYRRVGGTTRFEVCLPTVILNELP